MLKLENLYIAHSNVSEFKIAPPTLIWHCVVRAFAMLLFFDSLIPFLNSILANNSEPREEVFIPVLFSISFEIAKCPKLESWLIKL